MSIAKTHLFVISDLHLGGSPAKNGRPAFQICSATGRERLAAFVDWVKGQKSAAEETHLVIAEDIVDFLAESRPSGFRSFITDDQEARDKLGAIIDDTREIWDALRRATKAGVALTLILGNHDLELSLPGPRRLLLDQVGPGKVEFIYDNQAYTLGPVLIEHGNRYDD
jgi:UDP-2,3-diacylglucosamine pyrophosphatase LpxH